MFYETTTAVAAFGLLLWLYFGPLARFRREHFRSDIRAMRDELFDFVWKNNLSFDDNAYRECRDSLNAVLRASNMISFAQFIMVVVISPGEKAKPAPSRQPRMQAQIDATRARMGGRIAKFVFGEGIVGWLLWSLVIILRATRLIKATTRMATESVAGLEILVRQNSIPRRKRLPGAWHATR